MPVKTAVKAVKPPLRLQLKALLTNYTISSVLCCSQRCCSGVLDGNCSLRRRKKKIFNRSPYLTLQLVIFTFPFESFKTIYQDPKKGGKKKEPHMKDCSLGFDTRRSDADHEDYAAVIR